MQDDGNYIDDDDWVSSVTVALCVTCAIMLLLDLLTVVVCAFAMPGVRRGYLKDRGCGLCVQRLPYCHFIWIGVQFCMFLFLAIFGSPAISSLQAYAYMVQGTCVVTGNINVSYWATASG